LPRRPVVRWRVRRVRLHLALFAANAGVLALCALIGVLAFDLSPGPGDGFLILLAVTVVAWGMARMAVYTTERSFRRLLAPADARGAPAEPSRFEITPDESGMYDLRSTLDQRFAKAEQRRRNAKRERDLAMRILD